MSEEQKRRLILDAFTGIGLIIPGEYPRHLDYEYAERTLDRLMGAPLLFALQSELAKANNLLNATSLPEIAAAAIHAEAQ